MGEWHGMTSNAHRENFPTKTSSYILPIAYPKLPVGSGPWFMLIPELHFHIVFYATSWDG